MLTLTDSIVKDSFDLILGVEYSLIDGVCLLKGSVGVGFFEERYVEYRVYSHFLG